MAICHPYVKLCIQNQIVIENPWLKYMVFVFDDIGGGEPWLSKSTIRRRVMLRLFGEVA